MSLTIALLSYLIGSIPTAYFFVKWKAHLDIREAGSGNVGAYNVYDVTHSKWMGIVVLVTDVIKGALIVLFVKKIFGDDFFLLAFASLFGVIGHSYPIWLKFKGGRGLATAAGSVLVLNWTFVALWCSIWAVVYWRLKDIHIGNIVALISTPVIFAISPKGVVSWALIHTAGVTQFVSYGFLLCSVLFLRHLQPLAEIMRKKG